MACGVSPVVMFLLSGQLCFRLMSSPSAFPIRYLSFYSLSLSLCSLYLSLSFSSPSAFPIIFPHKLHVFCLKYSDSPSNMTILVFSMMKWLQYSGGENTIPISFLSNSRVRWIHSWFVRFKKKSSNDCWCFEQVIFQGDMHNGQPAIAAGWGM